MRRTIACGRPIQMDKSEVDEWDIEIAELRREVEQLQWRLNQWEGRNQGRIRPKLSSGEEENPFNKEQYYSSGDYHPQRGLPQRRDNVGDVKVDIMEFKGKMNGDIFLDWLYTVDRVFDYKELSYERKVKLVAIKLKGYASFWWENLKKKKGLVEKG